MTPKITETDISGCYLIEWFIFSDIRGDFRELFRLEWLEPKTGPLDFIQENISHSKKWVFRGFHFQKEFPQAKYVSVISGKILDFIIDLRVNSPTYKKLYSVEICAEESVSIFIPKGCAHGFLSLTDNTGVHYKADEYYSKDDEAWIRYDDRGVSVDWDMMLKKYQLDEIILSEKDILYPDFLWIK